MNRRLFLTETRLSHNHSLIQRCSLQTMGLLPFTSHLTSGARPTYLSVTRTYTSPLVDRSRFKAQKMCPAWLPDEDKLLLQALADPNIPRSQYTNYFPERSPNAIKQRIYVVRRENPDSRKTKVKDRWTAEKK